MRGVALFAVDGMRWYQAQYRLDDIGPPDIFDNRRTRGWVAFTLPAWDMHCAFDIARHMVGSNIGLSVSLSQITDEEEGE